MIINASLSLVSNSTTSWPLPAFVSDGAGEAVGFNHSTSAGELTTLAVSNKISQPPCGGAGQPTSNTSDISSSGSTPSATAADEGMKLSGSLDALLYIVIVLLFYAFSIVILMIKYVRREREEANLRNYYHEFVSRDKFRSPQYRNKQSMKRIFGRRRRKNGTSGDPDEGNADDAEDDGQGAGQMCELVSEGDNCGDPSISDFQPGLQGNKLRSQTITRNGNTFSRLLTDCDEDEEKQAKESFKFLSAKNQFCKKGFFGKRFCNKQMCSKCVSEHSAPTIDWGDGRCTIQDSNDMIKIRFYQPLQKVSNFDDKLRGGGEGCFASDRYCRPFAQRDEQLTYTFERDNDECFQPIIECDSELEEIDTGFRIKNSNYLAEFRPGHAGSHNKNGSHAHRNARALASVDMLHNGEMNNVDMVRGKSRDKVREMENKGATAFEEAALVSSCSLEVSELLAHMPPLGGTGGSRNSHDLDTLDGLSNLESEAESQSLLNFSTNARGRLSMSASGGDRLGKLTPSDSQRLQRDRHSSCSERKAEGSEGRQRDMSDFLSERTSLLSCTLSIANGDDDEDEEGTSNPTSVHHHGQFNVHPNSNGFSHSSNSKIKEDLKSNGKSFLKSLSKSASSEDGDVMRILNDISLLTENSGVFKNLKYFLRGFSATEEEAIEGQEKSNLLPKETYFGPGSPKSIFVSSPGDKASESAVVIPTTCVSVGGRSPTYRQQSLSAPAAPNQAATEEYSRADSDLFGLDVEDDDFGVDDDGDDEFPCYGEDRWAYAYDEEDEIMTSDGERSSSFGDYCMGEPSESQVIDLSQPLVRRQLDEKVKARLSQAFFGMDEPWLEKEDDQAWRGAMDPRALKKANPLVAGYGPARKETKV
ncbi:hypothetical protein PoB_004550900 [Plakobranchus ocellatus]|uniref:Uncharacterized protein n=1 Tax=Plakobranchus ocellatus TaxID=259542 RepID=A0AAV4BL13_9GAST|nr:hypothetical protein PoB_004550900 [Plakobranchus ocellatus]